MRNFIDRHIGIVLYVIRVPTRFFMIYLGSQNASVYDVIYFMLLSLVLIAWVQKAPVTLFRQAVEGQPQRSVIGRMNASLWRQLFSHLSLAILMASFFYFIGYYSF